MTAPYWGGVFNTSGGAIDLNGQSYITIDGGTNGTITATASGTNLANQPSASLAIYSNGGSHVTVQNMTITNIYVHTCTPPIGNCTDEQGQDTYGIWLSNGGYLSR